MIKKIKKIAILFLAIILHCLIILYRKFRPIPPRICFCYNQSIHHIYHSIFIAIELSNIQNEYEVVVYSTSREASEIIEGELSSIPNRVKFIKIYHLGYNKIDFNINWFVFLCRLRMHKPKAVIVTDYYDNVFRQLLLKTFWVYVFHGLENRGYTNPHIKDYDLVILSGEGELGRIQAIIGTLNKYAIIGYSKFDYFRYHKITPPRPFDESKPVIMYNPHFEKTQSSFFDKGIELLESLSETKKYNIIFMPHPDLARQYPELVNRACNIPRVAFVSRPKINLDYMAIADIYITDVSSAVFEWFYFNKPVLFFNAKKIDLKSCPSWVCGPVIEDIREMFKTVEYAIGHPADFQEKRKKLFNVIFCNQDKNVSKMIAGVIWDRLKST